MSTTAETATPANAPENDKSAKMPGESANTESSQSEKTDKSQKEKIDKSQREKTDNSNGVKIENSQSGQIDNSKLQLVMYDGMLMPQVYEPVDVHVGKVKKLKLRSDDVLLCSYPKSGTHWLWRILDMLVHGSAEYCQRFPDATMLDMMLTENIDTAPSPRVLNSHYPFDLLPEEIKDGKVKVKLVHVYRHPKAVMASLYFQLQTLGKIPDLTLNKLEAMIFSERGPYKNQFYYFDKLAEYEKNNPQVDIYHVAYEDMKKDTFNSIKQIAAFLALGVSDDLCSQIAEAVGFNNQKHNEEKLGGEHPKNMHFYRKGEIADWKNHLTVAQNEKFDEVLKGRATTCKFCRRYYSDE